MFPSSLCFEKGFGVPMTNRPRPVVLCILDGWGFREDREGNAIALADTPVFDRLMATQPWSLLRTSAEDVGLPPGQMGNSEVGHTSIGAGRIVLQDLPRIDSAVADGSLESNPVLRSLGDRCSTGSGRCHLVGLVSPGGVHAHQKHIAALARALSARGLAVEIHAILDGRDTPPMSATGYLETLAEDIRDLPAVRIATIGGRYFAMDRDKRWERVEKAYDAIVSGKGPRTDDAIGAINDAYGQGTTDEFVEPVCIGDYDGMHDGDALVVANFRADRIRQIASALLTDDFDGFTRERKIAFSAVAGMTSYSAELDAFMDIVFPPVEIHATLGEVVSAAGLKQLRIAETEKYAHVTFFFNGGEERVFEGEDRILVPSPKVATYDLQPEMSAPEVAEKLVAAIDSSTYDLIICNFANTDMVGHTGKLQPAIAAVEAVDACLGRVEESVKRQGGALLITADHGNAERMFDDEGGAHTAHTTDEVPLLIVVDGASTTVADGRLSDIAPTILDLMGLAIPRVMDGASLLRRDGQHKSQADTAQRASA